MSVSPGREKPEIVRWPVMTHDWNRLLFIHWAFPPEVVGRLLPSGLEPDLIGGRAWVGVIPFLLTVRPLGLGLAPLKDAPEINVRTYVRGPQGIPGIHFLSLELGQLWAATFARYTYRLPYRWSRMRFDGGAGLLHYESRRHIRGIPECSLTAKVGKVLPAGAEAPLELFLTARWRLYSQVGGLLLGAPVEHPAWRLHRARLLEFRGNLLREAGLPPPVGEPHVLYSPGTRARFGLPLPVRARNSGGYSDRAARSSTNVTW